ncbi:MAG: hypothetical protein VX335_04470 [Pseudomonadota bacterium]|nr:hypothetical protein [Pseudomonadota bacterium]
MNNTEEHKSSHISNEDEDKKLKELLSVLESIEKERTNVELFHQTRDLTRILDLPVTLASNSEDSEMIISKIEKIKNMYKDADISKICQKIEVDKLKLKGIFYIAFAGVVVWWGCLFAGALPAILVPSITSHMWLLPFLVAGIVFGLIGTAIVSRIDSHWNTISNKEIVDSLDITDDDSSKDKQVFLKGRFDLHRTGIRSKVKNIAPTPTKKDVKIDIGSDLSSEGNLDQEIKGGKERTK